MRIITEKLQLQPNERFILCDECNTSFVASCDEALDELRSGLDEDEDFAYYTFVCPCCGIHRYVFGTPSDD